MQGFSLLTFYLLNLVKIMCSKSENKQLTIYGWDLASTRSVWDVSKIQRKKHEDTGKGTGLSYHEGERRGLIGGEGRQSELFGLLEFEVFDWQPKTLNGV